jgi:prophage regulatory protein
MKILSPAELITLKGIRFSNPYRLELEAEGKFPRRVKIGQRKFGYVEAEIDDWLRARIELRNSKAAA